MAIAISDVDGLVRNARHNTRFAWVRLPVIVVVAGFVCALCGVVPGALWTSAMLTVERASTMFRGRLIGGASQFAVWHLASLAAMSLLWVAFGLLLWSAQNELGRVAAIIGLLTTALYGALSGVKDLRPGVILTLPSLVALVTLISTYAWHTWAWPIATLSTLGTLGAAFSVMICAWALNHSDRTLESANMRLARAAEAHAEQAALLEETSAAAQVGGWRLDLKTRKIEWTAQTRRLLALDDAFEPTLEKAASFHAPHARAKIEAAVRHAIATGEGWDLELEIDTARGERRWFRSNGKARFQDGRPVALIGAIFDVTDRVRLEEELRQSQKLESIGRLTGGIAHDFNNILTAILNSAESLNRSSEPRTLQIAHVITRAAERGSDLTDKLLSFSRKQALSPQTIDVNVALREARELITPLLKGAVTLTYDLYDDPLYAVLDRAQFISALINLAINACDAMPAGGALRIASALDSNGQVVVCVTDTGEGMSDTLRTKIFDPFFTTKPAGVGTGLGLSMVHGFVSQSGGVISVASAPGQGSTFTMRFPQTEAPLFAEPNSETPVALPGAATRLLLVDDDELVRESLAVALRVRGYAVEEAECAAAALAIFAPGKFDVAIVDVVLTHEMAGPELVQTLLEQDPQLRAVLASGYAYDKDLPAAPGRVQFLAKPFAVDTLIARMNGDDGLPESALRGAKR